MLPVLCVPHFVPLLRLALLGHVGKMLAEVFRMLRLQGLLTVLLLSSGFGIAQDYLDGREVLVLMNTGRYQEAFALAEKAPEKYAQWAAVMIKNAVPPVAHMYNLAEAAVRAAAHACRYAGVNKESEAWCYQEISGLNRAKEYDPRVAHALTQVSLPSITSTEAAERLNRLVAGGVPLAVYYSASRARDEQRLRELANQHPYSLGGVLAAGFLSLSLWERERYAEAVALALRGAGVTGTAGGVLAYGEYHGVGVGKNQDNGCRRALFWAKRNLAGPAVYTLGLCYRDGAGGFPKDLTLAYGIFWTGKEYSRYSYFADRVKELEGVLSPDQRVEGRRRGGEFFFQ